MNRVCGVRFISSAPIELYFETITALSAVLMMKMKNLQCSRLMVSPSMMNGVSVQLLNVLSRYENLYKECHFYQTLLMTVDHGHILSVFLCYAAVILSHFIISLFSEAVRM